MNQLDMTLTLDGIGSDFGIVGLDGEEALFGDYAFDVIIASPDHTLDLRPLLTMPATLTLRAESMPERHFSGVVLSATFLGDNPRNAFYNIRIVPAFSLLRMTRCSWVFTNKTVIDIVEEVLDRHGIADRSFLVAGSFPKFRHYTQNNCSSFQFVRRIMADEGVYYFYRHGQRQHTLIVQDYGMPFESCGVTLNHAYTGTRRFRPDEIECCSLERRVVPSRLITIPVNTNAILRRPAVTEGSDPYDLRYEWAHGNATSADHLEALSDRRQASFEASAHVMRARSHCPLLCPGYSVRTTGATRADLNGDFVVKRIRHRIDRDGYSNEFVAFPIDCRYVPLMPTDELDIDDNHIAPFGELLARKNNARDL